MRKINKIINIALIFMITGVVLETEIVYALRPALITNVTNREVRDSWKQRKINRIKKIDKQRIARLKVPERRRFFMRFTS
jgi:hypothetical protein